MCIRSKARLWLALLGMFLVGAGACSPAEDTGQVHAGPDVLLVTIDTLRADHLACYGYSRTTSPVIDGLALGGTRFDVAYAPVGATCPSHATLFTAHLPSSHGVVRNGIPLGDEAVVLADFLRESGYHTAGFISSYPLKAVLGFARGFDHYDDHLPKSTPTQKGKGKKGRPSGVKYWEEMRVRGGFWRPAEATANALIRWLQDADPDRPVFVWLHLFDPHKPYEAPPPFRGRFDTGSGSAADEVARYDEEILHADFEIGRTIAAMSEMRGARDRLVVVTSDHGQGLLDHGQAGHNWSTYEEEVRVPLIFHWPGRIPAGHTLDQPAQLADLPATIASLLGLTWPGGAHGDDGVDLASHLLTNTPADSERTLFMHRPFYPDGRAKQFPDESGWGLGLRRGKWKYFEALDEGRRELYDVDQDPGETTNVHAQHAHVTEELAALLAAWRVKMETGKLSSEAPVTPDLRDALRALGYGGDEQPADSDE